MWSMYILWFFQSLRSVASVSPEHLNIGMASVFSEHSSLGMHGIEGTTHFPSFARTAEITLKYSVSSDETSKDSSFRRASCNLVFPLSLAAMSSSLCFFDSLGHSSGQIESSRVVFWTVVGQPCTHVYPCGCFLLNICKRVVPIHASESVTSLSAFQSSFSTC